MTSAGGRGDDPYAAEDGAVEKSDPIRLITHRFKLDKILDAYETFGNAAKTKALKVIIEARRTLSKVE